MGLLCELRLYLLSSRVIVPSKSVKNMSLGFVFMYGSVVTVMMKAWLLWFRGDSSAVSVLVSPSVDIYRDRLKGAFCCASLGDAQK